MITNQEELIALVTRTSVRTFPDTVAVLISKDNQVSVCFPMESEDFIPSNFTTSESSYQQRLANFIKQEVDSLNLTLTEEVLILKDYENGELSLHYKQFNEPLIFNCYSEEHNDFIFEKLLASEVSQFMIDIHNKRKNKFKEKFYATKLTPPEVAPYIEASEEFIDIDSVMAKLYVKGGSSV